MNLDLELHHDKSCVVCGSDPSDNLVGLLREHEYRNTTTYNFPLVECTNCLLMYLYPRPSTSELARIYPKEYYAHHLKFDSHKNLSLVEKLIQWRTFSEVSKRLDKIGLNVGCDSQIKVLDIGCGTGRYLEAIKFLFPNSETHGVDFDQRALDVAKTFGHNTHHGRFEDIDLPTNYFDLIISIHVIEHVARPDIFLENCKNLLNENGTILIETPNTDYLGLKMFKKCHWGGYHTPRHWYLFRSETFEKLANKLQIKVTGLGYYANPIFWLWTLHSISLNFLGRRISSTLFPPVQIFFGGLYSLFLLGSLSFLERTINKISGKGSCMWISFKK
jgi:2-polyprenyl-3-methyl-5-hydroxy-6-metoxy-1,4-benzoquinol methylase